MPSDHYHVHGMFMLPPDLKELPEFAALGAFTRASLPMAPLGAGPASGDFYSLKNDMDSLRAKGAGLGIADAATIDIGKSLEGLPIWALKVGKNPANKVLITGCHHAREWISVEIPYLLAEYLINNYKAAPTNEKERRIYHLIQNREILFVPLVNPDGHHWCRISDRFWRPNRREITFAATTPISAPQFGGGTRSISMPARTIWGVDINRNYDANWGQETYDESLLGLIKIRRTSRDPRDSGADSIFCGMVANSEPETMAISALGGFQASLTCHNFSQLLLYPDGAEGDAYVQAVGKGMKELLDENSAYSYTYQSGSKLYPTTGDLMEFSHTKAPGRPTYTVELPPEKGDEVKAFSGLPESEIRPIFEQMLGPALALINCAGFTTAPPSWSVRVQFGWPPVVVTHVSNCWNAFKGWKP
jgi:carboxypeptidase T